MTIISDLKNLKRLQEDSEKQVIEFNEIIPFEHNPPNVYSPKLVNLLLQIGPQIESVTDLIMNKLKLEPGKNGLPSRISAINSHGILTNFKISSLLFELDFKPFENSDWWDIYNQTKHDLSKSQFQVTYSAVLNSLAVLASLHLVANVVGRISEEYKPVILEAKYWQQAIEIPVYSHRDASLNQKPWRSKIFKISNYCVMASNA